MRKQTSELFYSFDKTIKGPTLRMSAWLLSLLASFLMGGALYALLSVCLDVSEAMRFRANRRPISIAAPNNQPLTRTALLHSALALLFIFSVYLALSGRAFAQTACSHITANGSVAPQGRFWLFLSTSDKGLT